jgi:hypothetical protein
MIRRAVRFVAIMATAGVAACGSSSAAPAPFVPYGGNGGSQACVCGSTNCEDAATAPKETDSILPQIGFVNPNSNISGADDRIGLIWYDNTTTMANQAASSFGTVLGQASTGDGGSTPRGYAISAIQTGFAVVQDFSQEVDASAWTTKVIGLSPETLVSPPYQGLSASHGGVWVYNQEWATQ